MSDNLVTYSNSLNTALENSESVHDQLNQIVKIVDGFSPSLDSRIVDYHSAYFNEIQNVKSQMTTDIANCSNSISWLGTAIANLQETISEVNSNNPEVDRLDDSFSSDDPNVNGVNGVNIGKTDGNYSNDNPNVNGVNGVNIDKPDDNYSNDNPNVNGVNGVNINKPDDNYSNDNPNVNGVNGVNIDKPNDNYSNENPNVNGVNGVNIDKPNDNYSNENPNTNGVNGINIDKPNDYYSNENPNTNGIDGINIDKPNDNYSNENPDTNGIDGVNINNPNDNLNQETADANAINYLGAGLIAPLFGGFLGNTGASNTEMDEIDDDYSDSPSDSEDIDSLASDTLNDDFSSDDASVGTITSLRTDDLDGSEDYSSLNNTNVDDQNMKKTGNYLDNMLKNLTGDPDITLGDLFDIVFNPYGKPSDAETLLEHFYIDSDIWNSLPKEVQDMILSRLKEVGYSPEEIEKIIHGEMGIVSVIGNTLKETLEEIYSTNPEIREILKELYGFDIFNEDGTVNMDRLISLLLIDQKDGMDQYSLITLLHDQFGIELIPDEEVKKLMQLLEKYVKDNPFLRALLIRKYGFDIFNPDGTVNYEKLIMALLIDGISPDDVFDLLNFLEKSQKYEKAVGFLGNMFNVLLSPKFKDIMLGLLGFGFIVGLGKFLSHMLSNDDGFWGPLFKKEKYYYITKEAWESFSVEEKSTIQSEILEVGYSKETIECLEEGCVGVLNKPLKKLYKEIEKLIKEYPELKESIENVYHFSLGENDTINMDKLTIIIVIDYKNYGDSYDICHIINEKCGVEIALEDVTDELIRMIELAASADEEVRNELEEEFGPEIIEDLGEDNKNQFLDLYKTYYMDEIGFEE